MHIGLPTASRLKMKSGVSAAAEAALAQAAVVLAKAASASQLAAKAQTNQITILNARQKRRLVEASGAKFLSCTG